MQLPVDVPRMSPKHHLEQRPVRRLQSSAGLGAVFRGTERLLPHTSDLCYFCWTSRTITCHDSPSFQVRCSRPCHNVHCTCAWS